MNKTLSEANDDLHKAATDIVEYYKNPELSKVRPVFKFNNLIKALNDVTECKQNIAEKL